MVPGTVVTGVFATTAADQGADGDSASVTVSAEVAGRPAATAAVTIGAKSATRQAVSAARGVQHPGCYSTTVSVLSKCIPYQ